jgi:hypothetical protein
MTAIKATVRGGRIELEVPKDWPDGTEVAIQPLEKESTAEGDVLPPEEIARLLAVMDRMEPLQLTDAERAAWETERQARKDWEKAEFAKRAEKLQRMWE